MRNLDQKCIMQPFQFVQTGVVFTKLNKRRAIATLDMALSKAAQRGLSVVTNKLEALVEIMDTDETKLSCCLLTHFPEAYSFLLC